MTRLSIAIMAVPERKELVFKLQEQLGRRVPVLWDEKHEGCWWNARRAWGTVTGNATHHLVLSDDAEVCANFIEIAEEALAVHDDSVVTFFNARKDVLAAKERGDSWIRLSTFLWGQSMVMPVYMIPRFLRWARENVKEGYPHDDAMLGMFCEANEVPIYCTVPHLVNHLLVKSILGHQPPGSRSSHWFLGEGDGHEIDWTKGLENPLTIRYNSMFKGSEKWLIGGTHDNQG